MKKELFLRDLEYEDYKWIQTHLNDYEMVQHFSEKAKLPYTIEDAESSIRKNLKRIENKEQFTFIPYFKTPFNRIGYESVPIGKIDYKIIQGNVYTRRVWISKELWGQGYVTDLCRRTDNWIFENTNCTELRVENSIQNVASSKLKLKLGYKSLGIFEDPLKSLNGETKIEIFSLKKEDWIKNEN